MFDTIPPPGAGMGTALRPAVKARLWKMIGQGQQDGGGTARLPFRQAQGRHWAIDGQKPCSVLAATRSKRFRARLGKRGLSAKSARSQIAIKRVAHG
jgi:hypothetical protein